MNPSFLKQFTEINHDLKLTKYPSPVHKIGLNNMEVYLKRDDLLDLGCSKQRSIPLLMINYIKEGKYQFCISSSGNAALCAAYTALKSPFVKKLKIFLPINISDYKLQKFVTNLNLTCSIEELKNNYKFENLEFILSEKSKQEAFLLQKEGFINLRGSTEENATLGFKTIAFELSKQLNNFDAIFIPASSGTTAIGIYEGLKELKLTVPFHIIQTTKVNALLKKILIPTNQETLHPAEAIIDVIGHRRNQIEEIIKSTKGSGWIINSDMNFDAKEELSEKYNIETSYESALTFAALKLALNLEKYKIKKPVLMFTGA